MTNWFPGHMAKAMRLVGESMKLVDGVVAVLDARIPRSSLNGDLDEIIGRKPRLYVLGRRDLADPRETEGWLLSFKAGGRRTVSADLKSGAGAGAVIEAARDALGGKQVRGALKLMVVGIPNAGKSSLINRLAGRKPAKTENRPGVTRGGQWIDAGGALLFDTPGILVPKIESEEAGLNLAFTGAVRDEVLDTVEIAEKLAERLNGYGFEGDLSTFAQRRGMLRKGGEIDAERAAGALLSEFRAGKFGRITLESAVRP